ncbi:MAG TPA: LptA/OstA family protein [Bryobacteraceae bacterium]|jgi:lipopolysaccharide export system protein LptA|nr:LptA/OstA family protein [Bryobacteraceae bacterium]
MRRISVFLALAAILLTSVVAYTYHLRVARETKHPVARRPSIENRLDARADQGWVYKKDDPVNNRPIVSASARSYEATKSPSVFELTGLALRLYSKDASHYTYVQGEKALFDEGSGVLTSTSPVTILVNIPSDKDASKPEQVSKYVHVVTSGVTYETQTGHAATEQPASFTFADGNGTAVGLEYDPTKRTLHLKSKISLYWTGGGPMEDALHIEAGDLVYNEGEQKVYLSPWAKLTKQATTIQSQNALVTLDDGVLRTIDADHGVGSDDREGRHQDYSANTMHALFDDDGVLVNIIAQGDARMESTQIASKNAITADRADLRFVAATRQVAGKTKSDSDLHLVLADGHAQVISTPLPQPGVTMPETRMLRSEHVELEMKPGGKDIQEIRTIAEGQLEFKPNRPEQVHRTVDATKFRILYGPTNDIETLTASNVATHTDKPPVPPKNGKPASPAAPALTWSDRLAAKFTPNTNQIAEIEQIGNFRYEEGLRKARAKRAFLDQKQNKITLAEAAHLWDDTGSTFADSILMDQASGDMNATGHVISTHEADKNAKPGTSMLDDKQPLQGRADKMWTREDNTKVRYDGHAVIWQGADRTAADVIDIDRDAQTLKASGSVVSELVDRTPDSGSGTAAPAQAPIFTIVHAPELDYQDDKRLAHYSGGVKLVHDKMTVTGNDIRAFLTPKTPNSNDSALDHAVADGKVVVLEVANDRTRTGRSEHCEYYLKLNKVVLNGGIASMVDSIKGSTTGRQLTYFTDDNRMLVEGRKNELAFSKLLKK